MKEHIFDFHGIGCRITFTGNHGWRLQSLQDGVFTDFGAGQTLAVDLHEAPYTAVEEITAETDGGKTVLTAPDGSKAVIGGDTIEILKPSGSRAAMLDGLMREEDRISVSGVFSPDERIYGTGERFDHLNRRGEITEIFAIDQWCCWEGNSYVPIPIMLSSGGHGWFVNRFEQCRFDLDSKGDGRYTLSVLGNAPMDLYVFATDRLSDVLYGYSAISGFSPEPAEWLYGTQVCRYAPDFSTPEGILDMAEQMEKNDFPWEAVIVEGWDTYDPDKVEALAGVSKILAKKGKRVMMYHFTGKMPKNAVSSFGAKPDYFVRRAEDGSSLIPETHSYNPADNMTGDNVRCHEYLDITDPEALKWWQDTVWGPLTEKAGVRGSKIDFCELFPENIPLTFHDGRSESGAHHWYPTLYSALMYRYYSSLPGGGMNFSRGGGIGAQRYPFLWAGDQLREWFFLRVILRGVLSAGLSGLPFMSFDMAAYRPAKNQETDPEPEVFTRGLEFGCFSANIQTHGKVMRPYDFDEPVKRLYRIYSHMHDAMRPYLAEQGKVSCETGLPLMRALALYDSKDENCLDIDDEYMLGDGLLVAPVLDMGEKRDVYLPSGSWKELFTGEVHEGGRWLRDCVCPMEMIPVFVSAGTESKTLGKVIEAIRPMLDELMKK